MANGAICWMRHFRQQERLGIRAQRQRHARVMRHIEVCPKRLHAGMCALATPPGALRAGAAGDFARHAALHRRVMRFLWRV